MYHVEIVKKYENENSSLKGIAKLRLSDAFEISNIRILEGKNGLFVSFPSKNTGRTDEDGRPVYEEIIRPVSKEMREQMRTDILDAYHAHRSPSLKISVVPVFYERPSNIRAYATVTVDDMIQIHGIRLMENAKGKIFVSFPSYETQRDGDKNFVDLASCLNGTARKDLEGQVESAYLSQLVEEKRKEIAAAREAQKEPMTEQPNHGKESGADIGSQNTKPKPMPQRSGR